MRFALLTAFCYFVAASAQSSVVNSYVATESPIAKAGLLANIGPSGAKSSGAKAGIVIASPSTTNPDYLFTWTRDSALVFKVIADQFTTGQDSSLRTHIDQYFTAQQALQQVSNPSGTVSTGGLAEPKFNIDGTAFTGPWGRPQRDGPALRATALITYANWLIANSNTTFVTNSLWPVIKLDLDYVSTYWNQSTFDLWEEVDSSSFFTTAVQHRALREGAALASKIGQSSVVSGYTTQAGNILCFLQSYWNPSGGYITANTGGGRSGKDANTALASIHTFDPTAGCDAVTFQPCSDKALSSLKVYVDSFRSIYGVNSGIASNAAVATGRYPEDVYFNGNPWYLTTAAVAEQLYDALIVWKQQGSITVTSTSLAFFKQFSSSITAGTYASSTSTYTSLISAIQNFADGFLAINAKYTPSNGGLSEQFDKNSGSPLSAADLTWSYASALTAFAARGGFTPASWGAKGLTVPSGTCKTQTGPTVSVTFNVVATTQFGENIFLTGSLDALKDWSTSNPIALSSANYPTWSALISVIMSMLDKFKKGAQKAGLQATAFAQTTSTKLASGSREFVQTFSLPGEAEKAAKILDSFLADPERPESALNSIPKAVLQRARGLAIFQVVKAGFVFSGKAGSGIVIARLPDGSWSAPSCIATGGVGWGLQIGADITDFVIVLNSEDAVRAFSLGGNVTIGGGFSATAGPIGTGGSVQASLAHPAPMFSYSKSKGLFAGVSLEGTVLIERKDANREFYGSSVPARDILGGRVPPPEVASRLYEIIEAAEGLDESGLPEQAYIPTETGPHHMVFDADSH
ncbi:hypothetical protein CVT26_004320 [Gymnopilus dilepis]|uniref:glucan 1,4-alpha-glucosidase n=1 Tax=Gymnopilus dilepis TaxID=231916 RepID=A0A409W2A3_9AGAR|nr:hypothetical protein CVT26_004320 [Gymnopilus dilepis]